MKTDCAAKERFYFATLELVFHWLPGILITVSSLAVVVNILLLLIISFGIYRKRVPAKRLLFVANRSLVDAVAAAVSLVYLNKVEVHCDIVGECLMGFWVDGWSLECHTVPFVPDLLMQVSGGVRVLGKSFGLNKKEGFEGLDFWLGQEGFGQRVEGRGLNSWLKHEIFIGL
jgi:hypothetical protein